MDALTAEQVAFVNAMRVARLATADNAANPHVMPVCYAYDGGVFYIALDTKPKRVPPARLKRVRNILENPQVALLIDRYSEDWARLAYLLVRGSAALLPPAAAHHAAIVALLRERYAQYRQMPIETQPLIAVAAEAVVAWGALQV